MTFTPVVPEDEEPTNQRDDHRHGVQPHAEGQYHVGGMSSKQHDGSDLTDELHEDSGRDERVDHHIERQETAQNRKDPEHEQRHVRETLWSDEGERTI